MVRSFSPRPVPAAEVDRLIDLARRAPSAGNTQASAFVVLEGEQTARLWDVTLPPERRRTFRWPGLLDAPVVVGPGSADPFGPKAVRASMGSIFARPPRRGGLDDLAPPVVALAAHGGAPPPVQSPPTLRRL